MTRRLSIALVASVLVGLSPGTAHADAAAPTDYLTEVTSVEPQVSGLDVRIEGGDSFVVLRAPTGREVIVLGYHDEPYLRFSADGTVERNRRSTATYENSERFGVVEVPDHADDQATPEWLTVGTDGEWAWHDHRSHWMGAEPPIGLEAGDSLPAQTIPLLVDGAPVDVVVVTTLVGGPGQGAATLGLLIGIQIGVLALWLGPATATLILMLVAAMSLVVGLGQFTSLPPATQPLHTWWLMPAIAVACAVGIIALYGRSALVQHGLLAIGAVQVLWWTVRRKAVLSKPVLPTDLPFWFDRTVTAAAAVASLLILAAAGTAVVSSLRDPAPRRSPS